MFWNSGWRVFWCPRSRISKQYDAIGTQFCHADILIPIYDVYYALIHNHIIDTYPFFSG